MASRRSVNDGASQPDSHCVSVSELQNVQKFRGRDRVRDARGALEANGTEPQGHGAKCISFAVYSSPFPTALSLMIGPDEPFNLRVQRTLAQAEVRVFLGRRG